MYVLFLVARTARTLVLSQFQPIKRWIGYHGITRWKRRRRNQRRIQWHYQVEIGYVGLYLYFCWIILSKVWASGVLSLMTDIPEMCKLYSEDKLYFCWVFAVRKFWLSQKSCCAWITSVPMEARDQGQEQQRREGNRRRLILYSREYHKNVDQWQQRKEKRRMLGWVTGATPWDTFFPSQTSCCSLLLKSSAT